MVKVNIGNDLKPEAKIILITMGCITFLETIALLMGFNGQLLRWVTTALIGLGMSLLPNTYPKKIYEVIKNVRRNK